MTKLTKEERDRNKADEERGRRQRLAQPQERCSICGRDYTGFGNNALPVNDGRCCDKCNTWIVIPHRCENLKRGEPVY